jgi:hypothetical protein
MGFTKFGLTLISGSGLMILLDKLGHLYPVLVGGTSGSFYSFLQSFLVVSPVIFALGFVLLFSFITARSWLLAVIFFLIFLILGFIIILPLYIGGS